eukprot:2572755-Pyramimonas_sp.AAC.1
MRTGRSKEEGGARRPCPSIMSQFSAVSERPALPSQPPLHNVAHARLPHLLILTHRVSPLSIRPPSSLPPPPPPPPPPVLILLLSPPSSASTPPHWRCELGSARALETGVWSPPPASRNLAT